MSKNIEQQLCDVLGVNDVSRETFDRLELYVDLLLKWSQRTNLISRSTASDVWTRHVFDSAQIFFDCRQAKTLVDIGSGAGLPGLVLAILANETRKPKVHLVESNVKKCVFLRTIVAQLDLNVRVHNIRVEKAYDRVGPVDVVTARAFAPLTKLLKLTAPWLEHGALGVYLKGEKVDEELESTRPLWQYKWEKRSSVTDRKASVLQISRLERIGSEN